MQLYWQLWDVDTSNQLAAFGTETEALDFVRELLDLGWKPADLTLLFDDDVSPVEDLPAAVSGDELARRAQAIDPGQARRTA